MMDMSICPVVGATVTRPVSPPAPTRALREAPPPAEPIEESEKTSTAKAAPPPEKKSAIKWWSKENFSFKDILDMLNPLQHLPVISTLYRAWTGEGIGGVARIIGGAIYGRAGGFISMATSVVNAAIGAFTGKDIGERVYAAVFGDPKASETNALAAASTPTSLARGSAGTRLALSLAPIAQASPAGADALTYRQTQTPDGLAGEQNENGMDRKRPSGSSIDLPTKLILSKRQLTRDVRDVIDALDLYDRLAPLRAPQRKKADSEKENDYTLGSRRPNREGLRE
ncbi:MAG TPA: hypothetical protein VGL70_13920 [Candidatus Binatia bacterium]|jgi:hypothetical protein